MSFQKAITEQAMKGINDSANDTLQEVFARRFSRRDMLRKAAAIAPTLVLSTQLLGTSEAAAQPQAPGKRPLGFQPISLSGEDAVLLPGGYGYQVLLKWGIQFSKEVPLFSSMRRMESRSRCSLATTAISTVTSRCPTPPRKIQTG